MKFKILLSLLLINPTLLICSTQCAPIEVSQNNFKEEVLKSDKPVVIDVYATWCGPCRRMLPKFENVAKELKDKYKFVKVDIDKSPEIAARFSVKVVPTIIYMVDGVELDRHHSIDEVAFKAKIEKTFSKQA